MACLRTNISLNENLVAELDEYAKEYGFSRSGAITQAVTQMLAIEKMQKLMFTMNDLFAALASGKLGELSETDLAKCDELEKLSAMISGKNGGKK